MAEFEPTVIAGVDGLRAADGLDLGATDWLVIEQERIDTFAAATGDDQWIHVDPVRAAEGPYGATIAHGYLTLALTNLFLPQLLRVDGISMGVNYGVDKVRFPAPVTVGSRVRCRGKVAAVTEVGAGVQTTILLTVEVEGAEKPACVVESLSRWYP